MSNREVRRLSLVVPVYNEGEVILKNLGLVYDYLIHANLVDDFEILVCNNGSTDNTLQNAITFSEYHSRIKVHSVPDKGLGLGVKAGFLASQYEIVMFYAIDFPFGFDVIPISLDSIDDNDVVIGSKGHEGSIINVSFKRRTTSKIYDTLIGLLFKLDIMDPQGSLMFKRSKALPFLHLLRSPDFFFETEFLIYANKAGLQIKEVPVTYINPRKGSTVNIIKDGISMLGQAIRLKSALVSYKE